MKRSRLKSRSKKMSRTYSKPGGRRDFVEFMLREYPWCMAKLPDLCTGRSVDVHEIVPRSAGGAILPPGGPDTWRDPAVLNQFSALCRRCHDFLTFNPAFARRSGFKKRPGEAL